MEVPNAEHVEIGDNALLVELSDARSVSVPLVWYPRLLHARPEERRDWRLIGGSEGIHWESLDEDISVEGLLAGRRSGESQKSLEQWLQIRASPRRFGPRCLARTARSVRRRRESRRAGRSAIAGRVPAETQTGITEALEILPLSSPPVLRCYAACSAPPRAARARSTRRGLLQCALVRMFGGRQTRGGPVENRPVGAH